MEQCFGHMPHNFTHAVRQSFDGFGGREDDVVFLYCTSCGDVIEPESEENQQNAEPDA